MWGCARPIWWIIYRSRHLKGNKVSEGSNSKTKTKRKYYQAVTIISVCQKLKTSLNSTLSIGL